MLLNDSEKNEVLGVDEDCTMKMTIDDSDKGVLMAILSQGFYSDGIGSLIRESVSNSLDSMKEAGNPAPIIVKLVLENDNFVFSTEDTGVGLSPIRIQEVFSKYGASTKRNSNLQLGGYGLGSKAPLSYTDSFTIISTYDGKSYNYLMFKGEDGTELSLIDMDDTDLPNGVTIKVTLKDKNDYEIFLEKMQQQLCFFEQVVIKTEFDEIDPEFKIIKNDLWKYSELNKDAYMHLCLEDVYYPLDFKQLNIEPISIPIGLNFSLADHIKPTPNRENIIYSPLVKQLILDRIKIIGMAFINQWNESIPMVETLYEAEELRKSHAQVTIYKDDDREIKIKIDKSLCNLCGVKLNTVQLALFPSLSVERLKSVEVDYLQEYIKGIEIVGGQIRKPRKDESDRVSPSSLYNREIILLKPGESLSKLQLAFIKWTGKSYLCLRKHKNLKLKEKNYNGYSHDTDTYYGLLELYKKPKSEWRTIITDYQNYIKKIYTDSFVSLDSIVPSNQYLDWKKEQKQSRKKTKYNAKEEITFGWFQRTQRGKYLFKYSPITVKLCDLHKQNKGITFYCHENVADEYNDIYKLAPYACKIAMLSERNYNKLQAYQAQYSIQNWIHVDDIWKKKLRPFSKMITLNIINRVLNNIEDYKIFIDEKYELLDRDYRKKCLQFHTFLHTTFKFTDNWIDKATTIYIKNKWLDYDKLEDFKIVVKNMHKYDFINYIKEYNTPTKVYNLLVKYLYLKQKKNEKINGIQYQTYDIDELIKQVLTPVEEVIDVIEPEPITESIEQDIANTIEESVEVAIPETESFINNYQTI